MISSLQPEYTQEVRDILLHLTADQPYDYLIAELIKCASASVQKCLHQLLISEELRDQKPPQLIRHMRQHLGENHLEERILRQLFLQRLPTNGQLILASSPDRVPGDELASIADKILEVVSPATTVSALSKLVPSSLHSSAPSHPNIQHLQARISSFTSQVHALVHQLNSFHITRPRHQLPHALPDCILPVALPTLVPSAGSTGNSAQMLENVNLHAHFTPINLPVGKLHHQRLEAPHLPGKHTTSHLFFVTDHTTVTKYLVDTGANISVFAPTASCRKHLLHCKL